MSISFTQLQCKEVISLSDGRRLGCVTDVQVALPEGQVRALTVSGPGRILGAFGSHEDYRIPWDCVRRIGPDTVLVEADPAACRCSRPKGALFRRS